MEKKGSESLFTPEVMEEAHRGFEEIRRGNYYRVSIDKSLSRRLKSIGRHMGVVIIDNIKNRGK